MSISPVVTRGYGSGGSIALIVTRGYTIGAAVTAVSVGLPKRLRRHKYTAPNGFTIEGTREEIDAFIARMERATKEAPLPEPVPPKKAKARKPVEVGTGPLLAIPEPLVMKPSRREAFEIDTRESEAQMMAVKAALDRIREEEDIEFLLWVA